MTFQVREARHDDVPQIVPWTTDTFSWGDYVPDRLPTWIDDPDSVVFVCADETDAPVALARSVMLSSTEGWLEAARVHPNHKRSGMGSAMNQAGVAWARERGARVVRLAIEAENAPARRQVEALGYRKTSSWVFADFAVDSSYRCADQHRLQPAPASDVDAAWMFWSTSDLAHMSRGLLAHGWKWRRATPQDLAVASKTGALHTSPAGWVIVDETDPGYLREIWVATTSEDAPRLLDGLLDLAADRSAEELTIKMPNLPWVSEALLRAGASAKEVRVYSLAV